MAHRDKKELDKEEEYFYKLDKELVEKKRKELDTSRAEQMAKEQKEKHWMKCPKCGCDLEEINLESVMIDRCPACEGIWLDHGELELLVDGQARLSKGFLAKLFG